MNRLLFMNGIFSRTVPFGNAAILACWIIFNWDEGRKMRVVVVLVVVVAVVVVVI